MRIAHLLFKYICGWIVAFAPLAAVAGPAQKEEGEASKPGVVITADPELDDNNTVIRAILYSSDVKFEGLIYVSSQFHWRGDAQYTKTAWSPTFAPERRREDGARKIC